MAERLKDMFFTSGFIRDLGKALKDAYPAFDQEKFDHLIFSEDWENMELKQRMHHCTQCLVATLPEDYPEALVILEKVGPQFKGFDAMIFPDFVEKQGLEHWDLSLPALALFNGLCSSEFAIRPFIARDPQRAFDYLHLWAEDEDFRLRRLASEGCRPRLPWAMALTDLKKDPGPILPILEKLKDDPEEFVQKSVANNLNDISKDHPDVVLDLCERWQGQSEITDWIIKRACRTLLKSGNTRALVLFGFGDPVQIKVTDLGFDPASLPMGGELRLSFKLDAGNKGSTKIRLEYAVDFVKAHGKVSRKIFQIREADYPKGIHAISRKHSFKDLTTRKHYPGLHVFTIVVNGVEKAKGSADLV